jgi:hypothetical protein
MFLDQLPGLRSMPAEFLGTLAIDAAPGAVAPTSLRARWNQRGEFLFSTTGPLPEPSFAAAFPFFPLGAGYRTTFVLLSGDSGASGDVEFFDSGGARLPPPLR